MTGVALVASLAAAAMGARFPSFIELRWQAPLDVSEVLEDKPNVLGVANGVAVIRRDGDCLLSRASRTSRLCRPQGHHRHRHRESQIDS